MCVGIVSGHPLLTLFAFLHILDIQAPARAEYRIKELNLMNIELSKTDVVFIYGHFQKELSRINKIESAPNCPFDKETIQNQKAPYLSVIQKLSSQFPALKEMDNRF